MPKRALVTGAGGFVGAVLARKLVEEGHDVHLIVRPETDLWRLADVQASVHPVDLTDQGTTTTLIGQIRPEWVFHLAAYGAYSWQTDFRRMVHVNILATMSLVEACLHTGFEAFINTGSSSEYGYVDHAPEECELPRPNSDYAVTKAAATLFCSATADRHTVRLTTLRLYSVFGPYEEPARFVPTLAVAALEGRLPPLVAPLVARDFVFTDDVVEAYLLAARHGDVEPGAVYNVGTGRHVTIEESVRIAREVCGIDVEPQWESMPNRTWDTETWVANPTAIRRDLGWQPRVGFEAGFRGFLSWLEENPRHLDHYRARRNRA